MSMNLVVITEENIEGTVDVLYGGGKKKKSGTVSGIIQGFNTNGSSIYLSHEDGDTLLEDGGGVLLECLILWEGFLELVEKLLHHIVK